MTHSRNRVWLCALLWGMTGLWLALIWYLSAQQGTESETLSVSLTHRVAAWLWPGADADGVSALEHLLRKAAHMFEYAVLAVLLAGRSGRPACRTRCILRLWAGCLPRRSTSATSCLCRDGPGR